MTTRWQKKALFMWLVDQDKPWHKHTFLYENNLISLHKPLTQTKFYIFVFSLFYYFYYFLTSIASAPPSLWNPGAHLQSSRIFSKAASKRQFDISYRYLDSIGLAINEILFINDFQKKDEQTKLKLNCFNSAFLEKENFQLFCLLN